MKQLRDQLAHLAAALVLLAPAAFGSAWGHWWVVAGCALSAVLIGVLRELEQAREKIRFSRTVACVRVDSSQPEWKLPGWFEIEVLDSLWSRKRALDVAGFAVGGLALGGLAAWLR